MQKNNITLSFKNIISFLNNLTGHFAGVQKIITLNLTILMLNFTNITLSFSNNSISALSYQSEIGIGFTFNPTLSVSLSSSDLIISNLTSGSSSNSNSINVSVATNASYGYTLSVNASSDYLTHSNNTNTFNGIATDADLVSLTTDNTWGYSTKLSNETSWNNYNGLSSSTSTTLIDNSNTTDSTGSIDFKIGAKAGSAQASGIYTNTINFIAISKVAPMSLLDSFIASGAEQLNGYFKMQDMTHSICSNVDIEESELQLIDVRDNKTYWVAKLKDDNCWMTQNLDLDIVAGSTNLTSNNTDLSTDANVYTNTSEEGPYAFKKDNEEYGYIYNNSVSTWIPERSTIAYDNLNSTTWQNNLDHPYSYDYLDTNGDPIYPDTNVTEVIAGSHGLSGNYYNWSATIASNNSGSLTSKNKKPENSICPKNWRLPIIIYGTSTNEFAALNRIYNNGYTDISAALTASPLWLIKAGSITSSGKIGSKNWGFYRSDQVYGTQQTLIMRFGTNSVSTSEIPYGTKGAGYSIRCVAR